MKKPTIDVAGFGRALERIQIEMGLREHVERAALDDGADPAEWFELSRPFVTDPRPGVASGRGERVEVEVGTMWNRPPFGDDDDPLGELRRKIAAVPGVEAVGDADVDEQLRAIWGFSVILRLSQ